MRTTGILLTKPTKCYTNNKELISKKYCSTHIIISSESSDLKYYYNVERKRKRFYSFIIKLFEINHEELLNLLLYHKSTEDVGIKHYNRKPHQEHITKLGLLNFIESKSMLVYNQNPLIFFAITILIMIFSFSLSIRYRSKIIHTIIECRTMTVGYAQEFFFPFVPHTVLRYLWKS